MSETQKMGFGYVDDNDESLQPKSGGVFGLNVGNITKFEYNPNAGKDGAEAHAIDIHAQIEEREFRLRIYEITGELYKGSDRVGPEDPAYNELYNVEQMQRSAVITHIVKSLGVTDEQIKAALATPPTTFAEWAKIMTALPSDDFHTKPVDIFLEWQFNISEGQTQTYLQLPKNMKGGRFLCPSQTPIGGTWKPVHNENGLIYIDANNAEHPFTRSANFMESNKANQQKEGEEDTSADNKGFAAQDNGSPEESTW